MIITAHLLPSNSLPRVSATSAALCHSYQGNQCVKQAGAVLIRLKYSPARKNLQNDVYQKLHFCVQEIYVKGLWRRGKYMFYFYFFLFFLFENTFMFLEWGNGGFIWHEINRKYLGQVMKISKSAVDIEVASSKYLLCTVWSNDRDLCS